MAGAPLLLGVCRAVASRTAAQAVPVQRGVQHVQHAGTWATARACLRMCSVAG
jgi:hypothetical protein